MRILFVENHPTIARVVVGEFLANFEVTIAPTVAAARAAFAIQEPTRQHSRLR